MTLASAEYQSNIFKLLNDEKVDFSIFYHDIFDFPLTSLEVHRWKPGHRAAEYKIPEDFETAFDSGYFFKKNRKQLIIKRETRKKLSKQKYEKAIRLSRLLGLIPTIKMIAITGALAMENADQDSDIDFMIISRKNTMWLTRGVVLVLLRIFGIPVRKFSDKTQTDKLCLNIWMDENDLVWRRRNIFTAHEIAQLVPLVNKDKVYEKFISKNLWIKDYWPKAVSNQELKNLIINENLLTVSLQALLRFFESAAYKLQLWYMRKKITRETITPTRALFHPVDWSGVVLKRLQTSS